MQVGTLAAGVGLLALAAYALTLAPSIAWQHDAADSGELAAAAFTFGVPHPTGYPLWLVLAAPIARLPFGGDVAWRLGGLSAGCAALAAGLLTAVTTLLVARRAGPVNATQLLPAGNRGPALSQPALLAGAAAGCALFSAAGVWNVAVVTETYALHLLLVVALLGAALLRVKPRWRALLGGAALANHVTAVPVVVTTLFLGQRRRDWHASALLGFLPGLAFYLLLPLRAHSHPTSNWGDPETGAAFVALVTGHAYRYLLVRPALGDGAFRFLATCHSLVSQFPLVFWPLALAGMPALYRRARPVVFMAALYLLFPVFYRAAGAQHYLLPAVACLALAAGLGAYRVALALERRLACPSPVLWLLLAAISVPALATGATTASLRGNDEARAWATRSLAAAGPEAILRTEDDDHTFALWYMQRVDHLRPDVVVVDQRLQQQSWYRRQLEAMGIGDHGR
jgi:hypothetical protein